MSFKFEKLTVWQQALDRADEIDQVTRSFPQHELYSLSAQIKRAADSVVLNIAEGSTLQTDAEFRRFLVMANRSAYEVVACLYLAVRRHYLEERKFQELYDGYLNLVRQLQALIKSLKS